MDRSESQFCRDEADRLLKLANECSDAKVRNHLTSWQVSGWSGRRRKRNWESGTYPKQLGRLG